MADEAKAEIEVRFRHVEEENRGEVARQLDAAAIAGVKFPQRAARVRRVTVCELRRGEEVLARGWAFCSVRDNFSRAKGRMIAEGRARKALAAR